MQSGDVTAEQMACSSSKTNLTSLNRTSVNLSASARTETDTLQLTQIQTSHFAPNFEPPRVACQKNFTPNFYKRIDADRVVCRREETTVLLNISEGDEVCRRDGWEPSSREELDMLVSVTLA